VIFELIFDLLNIAYVIFCFLIFEDYVKYKDLDVRIEYQIQA